MLQVENTAARRLPVLTPIEARALKAAKAAGWLTVTPQISQRAISRWQRECDRNSTAFAMVRMEPRRASLWVFHVRNQEWTTEQQEKIRAALASASGCVVSSNSVCAFAPLGSEALLMEHLLQLSHSEQSTTLPN
jgi:hypothetical protein